MLGTLDSFDDLVINVFGGDTVIDIGGSFGLAAKMNTIRLDNFTNLQESDAIFGPVWSSRHLGRRPPSEASPPPEHFLRVAACFGRFANRSGNVMHTIAALMPR